MGVTNSKGLKPIGNSVPLANMPAGNGPRFPVTKGTTHNSKFGKANTSTQKADNDAGKSLTGAGKTNSTSSNGHMANMPAHNQTGTRGSKKNMGTTKHAPGTVPGYLKR